MDSYFGPDSMLRRVQGERMVMVFRVVGSLFGLAQEEMPADLAELDAYREMMYASGRLHVSDWARTRAREIVFQPPVPLQLRPLVEAVSYVTVALLPLMPAGLRRIPSARAA